MAGESKQTTVVTVRISTPHAQALKKLPPDITLGVLFRALLDKYLEDKELPREVAAARTMFIHKPLRTVGAPLVKPVIKPTVPQALLDEVARIQRELANQF
jgi:hypothetical protein